MTEKGLKIYLVEDYCKKYNLDFFPKKQEYSLWEKSEFIVFKCKSCNKCEFIVKSLAYWKKTILQKEFKCPGCVEIKNKIINDLALPNYNLNDLPIEFRLKLASQTKWHLVKFTHIKEKCIYQCTDCKTLKEMLPHNLFLPRHFSCKGCKSL